MTLRKPKDQHAFWHVTRHHRQTVIPSDSYKKMSSLVERKRCQNLGSVVSSGPDKDHLAERLWASLLPYTLPHHAFLFLLPHPTSGTYTHMDAASSTVANGHSPKLVAISQPFISFPQTIFIFPCPLTIKCILLDMFVPLFSHSVLVPSECHIHS